tara:strand:- start:861 stop:1313 length:453 start_codon:yes stop_codon:yes gene_type:complete
MSGILEMRQRLINQLDLGYLSISQDGVMPIPKDEAVEALDDLFTVEIKPDEVIKPNQIVAWRKRRHENVRGSIDCIIMYDYDGGALDEQKVVYFRVRAFGSESKIAWGNFEGNDKITPNEMLNGWVSGTPYRLSPTSIAKTLNYSRRGFL